MKRLKISKLTVAQIHEVNIPGWQQIMRPNGALAGLRQAHQKGLCDFVGITARAIPLLVQLAATGEFDTVLVYHDYHPSCLKATESVIPVAANQQMGIVLATVLAGGLYTEQHQQAKAKIDDPKERQRAAEIVERLKAEPHTLPQNAFRFALADGRVSTVSSGAASVSPMGRSGKSLGDRTIDALKANLKVGLDIWNHYLYQYDFLLSLLL